MATVGQAENMSAPYSVRKFPHLILSSVENNKNRFKGPAT